MSKIQNETLPAKDRAVQRGSSWTFPRLSPQPQRAKIAAILLLGLAGAVISCDRSTSAWLFLSASPAFLRRKPHPIPE